VSRAHATLAGMYRAEIIVRAADATLKHWRPGAAGDDAILEATCKGLGGADLGAAEFFAPAVVFIREELGEAAVRQVRARHARATA